MTESATRVALSDSPEAWAQEPILVQRLVSQHGAQWVDAQNALAFAQGSGQRVLFFCGDPVRFPEGVDVAVVLPELQKAFEGRFHIGVVLRGDEDAVARRWGVQRWPSLVFLRDGAYVTTLAGMLDWTDYLARVKDALAMPTSRAPSVGIPLVSASAASSCH